MEEREGEERMERKEGGSSEERERRGVHAEDGEGGRVGGGRERG